MSAMSAGVSLPGQRSPFADPELRRFLEDFVRRRVPPSDVDDVVQTVLVDAIASERIPEKAEELRKYLVGIARHKVADFHRRSARERISEPPEQEVAPAPVEVREMVRWAEEQASSTRDGAKTLDWMAREGEGEKLETIAEEERVPAARVRQRVSRMRRWMRERWAAELAAVAAVAVLILVALRLLRDPEEAPEAKPELRPTPTEAPKELAPLERARALRAEALRSCETAEWSRCLQQLDEAKALDPEGDREPAVEAARKQAEDALAPRLPPAPPEVTSTPQVEPPAPPPEQRLKPAPKAPPKPSPRFEKELDQKQRTELDVKRSKAPKNVFPDDEVFKK